eukprot:gb/GECH01004254.1/.p1 GENE.gb/GECH01004254.1/~~gb/GECH01004254.1/.p1  ORF type:complete len:160 (+),score=18.55 gb/GECH01004254.1/:1-480(+)
MGKFTRGVVVPVLILVFIWAALNLTFSASSATVDNPDLWVITRVLSLIGTSLFVLIAGFALWSITREEVSLWHIGLSVLVALIVVGFSWASFGLFLAEMIDKKAWGTWVTNTIFLFFTPFIIVALLGAQAALYTKKAGKSKQKRGPRTGAAPRRETIQA